MSNEQSSDAAQDAAPPKPTLKQRFAARFRLSLAAVVTIVVGILLCLLAVFAWLLYSLDPTRVAWGDYMNISRGLSLVGMWLAACAMTYVTVRVWMNDAPLADARIRDGWDAGNRMLTRHGLHITDLPCYLVLGCKTRHEQEQWVANEGYGNTEHKTDSPLGIDWHVCEDRILIFCRDVGVYGGWLKEHASAIRASQIAPKQSNTAPNESNTARDLCKQSEQTQLSPVPSDQAPPATFTGVPEKERVPVVPTTSNSDGGSVATKTRVAAPKTEQATAHPALQLLERTDALVRDAQSVAPSNVLLQETLLQSPSSVDVTSYQHSLSRLLAQLSSARFPHSPINGALVSIDSLVLNQGPVVAQLVGRAIRSDLQQLESELGVQSPVTIAVTASAEQRDFLELGRRVHSSESQTNILLGRTFAADEVPNVESMNALADAAIQGVSAQINQLFRDPDAVSQPQNHRLVRVLIRCRRWRTALRTILVESFVSGTENQSQNNRDPSMVSGVFFVSPGQAGPLRCFVRSIFQRMDSQQNHLSWTKRHRRSNAKTKAITAVMIFVTLVLIAALMAQLFLVS